MIKKEDILSLEFLKKTEYTASHEGMRYRLGKISGETAKLQAYVWPEPLNFIKTPDDKKQCAEFEFSEEGIEDAVAWMNDRLFDMKK